MSSFGVEVLLGLIGKASESKSPLSGGKPWVKFLQGYSRFGTFMQLEAIRR